MEKPTHKNRFFYLSYSTKMHFLHVPQSKKVPLFGILLLAPQFGQTTSCLLNATYKKLRAIPNKGIVKNIPIMVRSKIDEKNKHVIPIHKEKNRPILLLLEELAAKYNVFVKVYIIEKC